jgi:mRNA interferase HigB
MRKGDYRNFNELRATFPSADRVAPYVIFNIAGNNYRLVAGINFQTQTAFIKRLMTHAEYDKWNRTGRKI